jgi:ferric-dicitrate binding protein FerR (iron transport regulator)
MHKKIEKIILKYFAKSASIDELKILSKWLDNPANIDFFKDLVRTNCLVEYSLIDFDTENEKQIIKSRIFQKQSKKQKIRYINFYKYAAAAILTIGLGYMLTNNLFNKPSVEIPTAVNKIIEPGTDKAILTLEDGTELTLEKGQNFKTQNANSNGEAIVYESTKIKSEEIQYNYLTIPRGGQYRLVLSDKTEVWLNSETKLKYPVTFIKGKTRIVELVYGEAYFDVSPSSENKSAKFQVLNQSQLIEVLGTEFNLKAYKDDDNVYTTLVEGKIAINLNNGKKQDLSPDQQAKWNPNTNSLSLEKDVNVYNEISWKYGVFNFNGKPLKEIMKTISRWYDVEIVFLNKKVEETEFVGVIRKNRNLEDILVNIKNFGVIKDYERKEKMVILK